MIMQPADPNRERPAEEVLGGRYELLEPIGRGGMSTVYRALDRALGRPIAVKVIRHDPAAPADRDHLRERFRREAANAARIPPHPNVVQIYDYGTDAETDQDFLVMELLQGQDLKAALRERRFSTSEAVRILLEAARGLAAGHRVGIVHRDVKPANILLTDDGPAGTVRILDFGIAKALEGDPEDDLTRIGGVPHTPAYASPEQRATGGALSPASDVYQLGLVGYELLTGERAYDAHDRERIAREDWVPLGDRGEWKRVPAPIRAVVERALGPHPKDRYPDAAAFAEALAQSAEDDRTLIAPPALEDATASAPSTAPAVDSGATGVPAIRSRWRGLPRAAWIALIGIIGVLLLWIVLRDGNRTLPEESEALRLPRTTELEEEFAPLYHDAAEWLAEEQGTGEP